MKYARLIAEFANQPLAIMPEKLDAVMAFLMDQAAGTKYSAEEIQAKVGAEIEARAGRGGYSGGAVAVIPVLGSIGQRMNMMQAMSGGTSTEALNGALRQAMSDPNVSTIVMDIDSPGGGVYGVAELGAFIADAVKSGEKPIIAQVNSLAASAAYWIASQATEIVVTPGGEVGSIGVYTVHEDVSAAAEQAGVKHTIVKAGKYKAEGSRFEPLADDAKAALQKRVDEYYGMFVSAVAQGRSRATGARVTAATVRNAYGEGRVVGAEEAVSLGMADRVGTLDDTLKRLVGGGSRRRMSAEDIGLDVVAKEGAELVAETTETISNHRERRRRALDLLAVE
jgi:capsid assembly protease